MNLERDRVVSPDLARAGIIGARVATLKEVSDLRRVFGIETAARFHARPWAGEGKDAAPHLRVFASQLFEADHDGRVLQAIAGVLVADLPDVGDYLAERNVVAERRNGLLLVPAVLLVFPEVERAE